MLGHCMAPTPTLKGYAAQIIKGDTFELLAPGGRGGQGRVRRAGQAAVTQSAGARVSVLFVCLIYIILIHITVLEHLVVVYEHSLYR